ncbi:hypothetical protein L218DRAFT_990705 [Marasmius fiardii PR-910]|nr:hypothetical protein L218DRAFT_990705 [Marasmius fiardii PR-910]
MAELFRLLEGSADGPSLKSHLGHNSSLWLVPSKELPQPLMINLRLDSYNATVCSLSIVFDRILNTNDLTQHMLASRKSERPRHSDVKRSPPLGLGVVGYPRRHVKPPSKYGKVSFEQYLLKEYNIRLLNPDGLPVADIRNNKGKPPSYLPAELRVCTIEQDRAVLGIPEESYTPPERISASRNGVSETLKMQHRKSENTRIGTVVDKGITGMQVIQPSELLNNDLSAD